MIISTFNESIPVIEEVDLLVIGGSLAGLAAACVFAENNKKVFIIEKQTFMGYEVGAWLRPWFEYKKENLVKAKSWLPMEKFPADRLVEGDTLSIHPDAFKRNLEYKLEAMGIGFLYMTQAMECLEADGRYLLVIGNKSGRQGIIAKKILDTTENGIMAYLLQNQSPAVKHLNANSHRMAEQPVVWRTIEFTGVKPGYKKLYAVDSQLNLYTDEIELHTGSFGSEHVYVDIPIPVTISDDSCYENDIRIEYLARKTSLETAAYIMTTIPEFSEAVLGSGSLHVMKDMPRCPVDRILEGEETGQRMLSGDLRADRCVVLNKSYYEIYGHKLNGLSKRGDQQRQMKALEYRSENRWRDGGVWPEIKISTETMQLLGTADVLVAGGGTAGPIAAAAAADEGVQAILLEMNSALGGAGTLGGVSSYWYGRRTGFTSMINQRVDIWHDSLRQKRAFYVWGDKDTWRAELKAFALFEMCLEKGIAVYLDCLITGTFLKENEVQGVVAATPYGGAAVLSKILLDATGDGDTAVFAGAKYVYGSDRDSFGMWASMAPYNPPSQYMGNFSSTVNMGDVFDTTRFILAERRRCGQPFVREPHDHAAYIAPRESRHIIGETIITLTDQLLMRKYPDTVQIAFSNHDPKGRSMADIIHFGIIPPNLEIEVPYRTMIPKELENLIVAGRAVSCTHDALCAIRMQDDIQQQAGAAGIAAAMSVKQDVSPRYLNVRKLQERLIDLQALPKEILNRDTKQSAPDLAQIIASLTGTEPLEWLEMDVADKAEAPSPVVLVCFAPAAQAVPLLEAAYQNSEGLKQLMLARLLLWHRSAVGLETVITSVQTELASVDDLPKRKSSLRFMHFPPDHGLMPEVLYLVYTLARVDDRRIIPVYQQIVDRLEVSKRDYWDKQTGVFHFIDCVAYSAERRVYPEFIPLLERLLRLPELHKTTTHHAVDENIIHERRAYLVVILARALARCGCRRGLEILAQFLEDNRSLLAFSAWDELLRLTGENAPRSYDKWMDIIKTIPEVFKPIPWEKEHS